MIRKLTTPAVFAIASLGLLTGCGTSQPGRTSGGMATGAGTGAAIGLIGGPIGVVIGAAVGAGAGALTATNTTAQQVNLGDPVWAREHGVPAGPTTALASDGAYGGMPPPQPLGTEGRPYAPPQPSPGAMAMPSNGPIQSEALSPPPPGQPTQLAPGQ